MCNYVIIIQIQKRSIYNQLICFKLIISSILKAASIITTIVNLKGSEIKTNNLFVIGGLHLPLAEVSDPAVMLTKKVESGILTDSIPNGDIESMSLILLYSDQDIENLLLTVDNPHIRVLKNWKTKISKLMIDMVVFGRTDYFERCKFFEDIYPVFIVKEYMLGELNVKIEKKLIMSRCTLSTERFYLESFRLGNPTPKLVDDRTLEHYTIANHIDRLVTPLIEKRPIAEETEGCFFL